MICYIQCTCHSGDSDSGEAAIPLVEIPIGVSTSGDADLLLESLLVELPIPLAQRKPFKIIKSHYLSLFSDK